MSIQELLVPNQLRQTRAIRKAQEVAFKILETSPNLIKELPQDSILKPVRRHNRSYAGLSTYANLSPEELIPEAPTQVSRISVSNLHSPSPAPSGSRKQTILSHVKCFQKYEELESRYKKLEKELAQQKVQERTKQDRYLKREEGFRKIIAELEERIKSYPNLVDDGQKQKEINDLHTSVLQKIDTFQEKASYMLGNQERDIGKIFDSKVEEIKQNYDIEMSKYKGAHDIYAEKEKKLLAELNWVKEIARKVESENQNLMQKCHDLKAQQLKKSEEERLLGEVIKYKRENAILRSQVEQYEQIIQETSKLKDTPVNTTGMESLQSQYVDAKGFISPLDYSLNTTALDSSTVEKSSSRIPLPNNKFTTSSNRGHRSVVLGTITKSTRITSLPTSPEARADNAVDKLKGILQRERKQAHQLKTAYIKELGMKNEINQTLKECMDEVRDSFWKLQKEKEKSTKSLRTSVDTRFTQEEKEMLIDKLTHHEKILGMIYDKSVEKKRLPMGKLPGIFTEVNSKEEV